MYKILNNYIFISLLSIFFVLSTEGTVEGSQSYQSCNKWFVSSDGDDNNSGDKRKKAFATLAKAEAVSAECDTIYVLPSTTPLGGGITLKNKQKLLGKGDDPTKKMDATPYAEPGEYSLIENMGGDAITCLGECKVKNIWVTGAFAGGIVANLLEANTVPGDLTVAQTRITNHNIGQIVVPNPVFGIAFPQGISYLSAQDGNVKVRDSIIEGKTVDGVTGGLGSGVGVFALGEAELETKIRSLTVENLSEVVPPGFEPLPLQGVWVVAGENSNHKANVRNSTFSNIIKFGVQSFATTHAIRGTSFTGGGYRGEDATPATIELKARKNTMQNAGDQSILVETAPDGPNQGSLTAEHNNISHPDTNLVNYFESGINLDHQAITPAYRDTFKVKNNVIDVPFYGVQLVLGSNPFEVAANLDVDISHNWIGGFKVNPQYFVEEDPEIKQQLSNPNGGAILLNLSSGSGDKVNDIKIEKNTIVSTYEAAFANGIVMNMATLDPFRAKADMTIRKNKMQLQSETERALLTFIDSAGACLFEPPEFGGCAVEFPENEKPGWDLNIVVEKNCVQDSLSALTFLPLFGIEGGAIPPGVGYSNQVIDFGGGPLDSDGKNDFIGLQGPSIFYVFTLIGTPISVPQYVPGKPIDGSGNPTGRVFAKNNYWDGGPGSYFDLNGLLNLNDPNDPLDDDPLAALLAPDFSDPRLNGPANCGNLDKPNQ